jgi:excisionase family DNA binding protein
MEHHAKPLTTGDVARYCGVSRMAVIRWIKQEKLKAYTTPGGHYRIRVADFRDFLQAFDMPVAARFFGEGPQRLLVVANDAMALGIIVKALTGVSDGYEIDVATDGASAMAKIADSRPALVILDTTASTIDVPELAEALSDRHEGQGKARLLLTASNAQEPEGDQARRAFSSVGSGRLFVDCVSLRIETLQAAVHRLLAKSP